jgi:hypothetical protein
MADSNNRIETLTIENAELEQTVAQLREALAITKQAVQDRFNVRALPLVYEGSKVLEPVKGGNAYSAPCDPPGEVWCFPTSYTGNVEFVSLYPSRIMKSDEAWRCEPQTFVTVGKGESMTMTFS